MHLILEEGDWDKVDAMVNDPDYGWDVRVSKQPSREPAAFIRYRGVGTRIQPVKVTLKKAAAKKTAAKAAA